jgi:predicted aldo/keto reductase-like oxidoreductase
MWASPAFLVTDHHTVRESITQYGAAPGGCQEKGARDGTALLVVDGTDALPQLYTAVMKTRVLGSTGLAVSEIGLGCAAFEYHASSLTKADVISTVRYAFDHGMTYFDLCINTWREAAGEALKGIRKDAVITGHLGCCLDSNGQYCVTRDVATCEESFQGLLRALRTDWVDVLFFHNVDRTEDLAVALDENGFLGLALRLLREGKARCLAISTHVASTAMMAIETGRFGAVMFPVNPAHDLLPGDAGYGAYYAADSFRQTPGAAQAPHEDRRRLYQSCMEKGVGIVAMKAYAGGLLLEQGRFIGGDADPADTRGAMALSLTQAQCISYALSQPGVSVALPGCVSVDEVKAALSYVDAPAEERDYSAIDTNALWKMSGRCVYCNHCLPCPAGIDIGSVMRLLDAAEPSRSGRIAAAYLTLETSASDCTSCGDCTERCPFGVPVIERMERAVEVFSHA